MQVNQLSMLISSLGEIKKLSHDNSVDFSLRLCLHKTWMNQNYILFIYGDDTTLKKAVGIKVLRGKGVCLTVLHAETQDGLFLIPRSSSYQKMTGTITIK